LLLLLLSLRRLSSHYSASLKTKTTGPSGHHVHSSRDQCGVTYKHRLKLYAMGHAAGRPLSNRPSHRPCAKSYRAVLVASRLHTCCASCSQFGDRPAYYLCACWTDLSPEPCYRAANGHLSSRTSSILFEGGTFFSTLSLYLYR
jgi:hypothetical protein